MKEKTIADISNGPDWVFYIVLALLAAMSLLLLLGKGSWLIAGYNTASEKDRQKYDEKRLCRVIGGGLAAETIALFVMATFEEAFPASFTWVFTTFTFLDCAVMVFLSNAICKRK